MNEPVGDPPRVTDEPAEMEMEMDETPLAPQLVETAIEAAKAGAQVLRHYFRRADLEVAEKSRHDFVTEADHRSEARILEVIHGRFPSHAVMAEESGAHAAGGDAAEDEHTITWIIDPLDGTSNFLQGLPVFCISIACRKGPDVVAGVVYDPMGDNLFSATRGGGALWNGRPMGVSKRTGLEGAFLATGYPFRAREALDLYLDVFRSVFLETRGIRRCGAAALDLAYTAAGVYDGFFEFRLAPWDIAAGILLVREAGGWATDLDGGEGSFASGNIVAGPEPLHGELLATIRRHVDEARLDAVEPRTE